MGIPDRWLLTRSKLLLAKYGLDVDGIYTRVRESVEVWKIAGRKGRKEHFSSNRTHACTKRPRGHVNTMFDLIHDIVSPSETSRHQVCKNTFIIEPRRLPMSLARSCKKIWHPCGWDYDIEKKPNASESELDRKHGRHTLDQHCSQNGSGRP